MTVDSSESVRFLQPGDEVAILPAERSSAAETLEIGIVRYVGGVYFRLIDGRMYSAIGGKSLGSNGTGYAVQATDEHRAALNSRPK